MAKKKAKQSKELTLEEKKARAEAIALKTEEARKKKIAASKARILQLKNVEENYSKENLLKIHDRWRRIMRAAKTVELHKDIEALSNSYGSEVRRKGKIITGLMQHLSEAEQQRQTAFSKHLQIMDGLIDIHFTRLKDMEDEFQQNLQKMQKSFEAESQQIVSAHEKQKKELNDMMHAMENECKELETDLRQEYEASREEIKNKSTEEYNVLKISLEKSIEDLERKIEETHQAYLESTDTKTQAFKRMMEKDKVTAHLIEQRMRKLLHLHESIAYRRSKIATDSREWESENKALWEHKDGMNKHYQDLKRKISKLRNQEREELKLISKISEEVQSGLKEKLEMAEGALKLARLNSKLELEQEKIFPFDPLHFSNPYHNSDNIQSPLQDEVLLKCDQNVSAGETIRTDPLMSMAGCTIDNNSKVGTSDVSEHVIHTLVINKEGKEVEEFQYLGKFHEKYNKVMLDKLALERQKQELRTEIDSMRSSLRRLLDGLNGSPNNDAMKKLKSLLNESTCFPKNCSKANSIDDILRIVENSSRIFKERYGVLAA